MIVLALDAAAGGCGAALMSDGAVLALHREEPGRGRPVRAVARLLPVVEFLLGVAGAGLTDVDGLAVTVGPGSYTGLRAAIATAKGLALALRLPVAPVGTLDALAYGAGPRCHPVATCMDARRGRVYGALYPRWEEGLPVCAAGPERVDGVTWLAQLPRPLYLVGPGASVACPATPPEGVALAPEALNGVDPAAVGALGWMRLRAGGGVDAVRLAPSYVGLADYVPLEEQRR
jgi:tRNA threonylcarbamoyladenosine biosynthesis protein TsaB